MRNENRNFSFLILTSYDNVYINFVSNFQPFQRDQKKSKRTLTISYSNKNFKYKRFGKSTGIRITFRVTSVISYLNQVARDIIFFRFFHISTRSFIKKKKSREESNIFFFRYGLHEK